VPDELVVYATGADVQVSGPRVAAFRGEEALLGAMLDLRLPEESAAACVPQAYRLMRAHGVTFYDAVYHGLAIARGGVMVTADRRYVLKARRSGHLQLLADWRPSRGR
jgi:predicted nucleic acid-binding protein